MVISNAVVKEIREACAADPVIYKRRGLDLDGVSDAGLNRLDGLTRKFFEMSLVEVLQTYPSTALAKMGGSDCALIVNSATLFFSAFLYPGYHSALVSYNRNGDGSDVAYFPMPLWYDNRADAWKELSSDGSIYDDLNWNPDAPPAGGYSMDQVTKLHEQARAELDRLEQEALKEAQAFKPQSNQGAKPEANAAPIKG